MIAARRRHVIAEVRVRRVGRGALLLEVMLSLTLFVVAGGAVLAIINQGVGSLEAARERLQAADLVRSAMAEIEAGIATPTTLNGPVPAWRDEEEEEGGSAVASNGERESEWELTVETSPTSFRGLTLVTIAASKVDSPWAGGVYTLRQLVRLAPDAEDTVGEVDDVTKAGERGEEREQRNGRGRSRRGSGDEGGNEP